MLKRCFLTLALVTAVTIPAHAEMLYRGTLKFTAVTAACTEGPGANYYYTSQFHPAEAPGNANFSALNRFYDYGASSYALDTGGFTSAFKQVSNRSIGWSDFTPDKPSFVLVSKQVPGTLLSKTAAVTLIGKLKNPFGNTGQENCIADFIFSGILDKQ